MDFFTSLPGVVKVWGKGNTKASVRMRDGFDMDLRVLPKESYGSALQYFTGSKDFNLIMRNNAKKLGYKLNEYGIYKGTKEIYVESEKEIFDLLEMKYLEPQERNF